MTHGCELLSPNDFPEERCKMSSDPYLENHDSIDRALYRWKAKCTVN
jgi:hypothetical protein